MSVSEQKMSTPIQQSSGEGTYTPKGTQTLQSYMGSSKEINAYIHISYIHSLDLICLISPLFPTALSKQPSCLANSYQGIFLGLKSLQNLLQKVPRKQRSKSSLRNSHWIKSSVWGHSRTNFYTVISQKSDYLLQRIICKWGLLD